MKRLIAFIMLTLCFLYNAHADNIGYNVAIDSIYYDLRYHLDVYGGWYTATVSSGDSKYSGNVDIPEQVIYKGITFSVTSIGESAFSGCSGLTSVTIPNSVTSIGNSAFYGCSGLTSVTIPNSVTSIGYETFYGCSGLTSVTIPNSVTSIGYQTFYGCSGLTSVTIPNSVTSIGNRSFYKCSGLASMTIGNSVTSIGDYAFYYCSGLTSVTIPNSVTSIGSEAFAGCKGLTSVTIEECTQTLKFETSSSSTPFSLCPLQSLYLGRNIFCNSYYSPFKGRTKLTSLTIGNSVTYIGSSAFSGCSGLTSLTIGNSVTRIGEKAFQGCSGLTSVTIPNSVTSIGNSAFDGCSGLTSVRISDLAAWCKIGFGSSSANPLSIAHHLILNGTEVRNLVIPDSVTSIGESTFSYCTGLTSVTIPNSVTSIGSYAFSACSGLTSLIIPNSVTSIGKYAFFNCRGLTSLTIPNSVTSIGESTFSYCTGLTSLTIPNSVTSIGESTFYYCTGLTSLTIPNSVTSIGESAFYYCTGLTSLTIPNSVTSIGESAFSGCSGLTSVTIEDGTQTLSFPTGSSSLYIFSGCPLQSLYLGRNISYNGTYSPFRNTSLTSVTIGYSVTSIRENDFSGYKNLRIKMLATTPPNFGGKICTSSTPVEVPFGSGCLYAKAVYWKDIYTLYTVNGSSRYYPVPINVSGETIISVNGKTDFAEGIEVEEGKAVNISLFGDGMVLVGSSDITSLMSDGHYSFTVSPWHQKNRIETYSYSYPTTTIQLTESGTLINQIGVDNLDKIGSLKVSGEVNGTDILTIRKMTNLKSLDLGEATIVGGGMSYYETYTTSFNTIGDYFFKDKTNLASVILPAHITSIKQRAFEGMSNLRNIIIPATVTEIASDAFAGCSGLEIVHLDIAATTLTMDATTFADCPVRTLYLGRPLSSNPFSGKKTLTEVTIGNGMTSIPSEYFKNCSGLYSIIVPLSLTSFGTDAFSGCTSLKEVHISDLKFWCDINFTNESSNPCCYAHSLWLNGKEIKDLTFPANVTKIRDYAFEGCNGLTSVTIGNSITSIGERAFFGCSGLTSLTIGNGVTSIGSSAFSGCSGLTSLTIGNSVTSIGSSAFSGCSGLTSLTIPNRVTSIGNDAFADSGLTSLTIEDGTRTLSFSTSSSSTPFGGYLRSLYLGRNISYNSSYSPFRDKRSLTSLTIGNSVTSIGNSAFEGCRGLTSVTIEDGPKTLSFSTNYLSDIYDFFSIKSLYLGRNISYSDNYSPFAGKKYLTSLTIGNSVTSIGVDAFAGCSGLTSLTIPNSVTSIGRSAFLGCSGLTSVEIPNSVRVINENVFCDCSSLTSVTIPNSVTSIGSSAFAGCSGLTSVRISDLAAWCKIGFGSSSANPLSIAHHLILNGTEVRNLTIPSGINSINDYAFYGGSSLTAITISENITSVGTSAFSGCSALTSVTIPNNVTSIGSSAFENCNGLTSVTIEDGTQTLSFSTSSSSTPFASCPLQSLYLGRNISYSDNYSPFKDKTSLTSLTIGNSVTSIGSSAFEDCSGLTSLTIGNSITSIGSSAFEDCCGLTSVAIGNSVTSIGQKAFYGCSDLTSVCISDLAAWCKIGFGDSSATPLSIAHHLILNGTEVKNLVIPSSVNSINAYAFYGGSSLTAVTIPDNVTSIGDAAFTGCDNLETVSLFCSTIGNWFSDKKNIKKIVLGDQIASIGEAFSGCTAVTEVHSFGTIPPEIVKNTFAPEAYENATLYVPTGCKSIYWLHPYWEDFSPIVEEESDEPPIPETCAKPTASVASDSEVTKGTPITLSCETESATIYYTLDRSTPTAETGLVYSTPIIINEDVTIKAMAVAPEMYASEVVEFVYKVKVIETTAKPTASIVSGLEVTKGTLITLSCETEGATIYYTLDGSTPTAETGNVYDGTPIIINEDVTIKAMAVAPDMYESEVVEFVYKVKVIETTAKPTASIVSGSEVTKGTPITLSCETEGATIYYTLDGFPPTADTGLVYSTPIIVNEDVTIKAMAVAPDMYSSEVVEFVYTVKKEPGAPLAVTLSTAGYATYYDKYFDTALPASVKASVVTSASDRKLTYQVIADGNSGGIVPAGTAVLLQGMQRSADTYTLTPKESTTSYTGANLLHGSDDPTTTTADGDCLFYKLAYGPSGTALSNTLGWFWGEDDGRAFTIEGHKAWLAIPKSATVKSRPLFYAIDGNAIELEGLPLIPSQGGETSEGEWYDLQGRKLNVSAGETPALPGVYIRDGKKVFIK